MQTSDSMIYGDRLFEGDSDLHGMIKGDLTLGQGAHVLVTGMVAGDIVNHGGTVDFG